MNPILLEAIYQDHANDLNLNQKCKENKKEKSLKESIKMLILHL
jgi:hypothetical protein